MNLNVYAIYDEVAKTYTQPMFMHNDNEARRLFLMWCKNPELPMAAHPADYTLYAIGFYDTDTGVIESQTPHNQILKGSSGEPATLKAVGDE